MRNFITQCENEETEGEDTDELEIPTEIKTDKEALDYVAAAAARHLGLEYGPLLATDRSWSGLKNRGALVKAARYVEENVYKINLAFNKFHKNGILVSGVQIHKRTIDFILRQDDCKMIERPLVNYFVQGIRHNKILRIMGNWATNHRFNILVKVFTHRSDNLYTFYPLLHEFILTVFRQ